MKMPVRESNVFNITPVLNISRDFGVFGEIAGVSTSGVQWISLALGKPPS